RLDPEPADALLDPAEPGSELLVAQLEAGDEARGIGGRDLEGLPELRQRIVLVRLDASDQAADSELCDELETPSSDDDVTSVAAVGIVEIEDSTERLHIDRSVEGGVGDVDSSVGEGCEELAAFRTKGSSTCAWYCAS